MEKGNGGEKKVEKGNGGDKKPAPVWGEEAMFLDNTKGYLREIRARRAVLLQKYKCNHHWDCIKNRVLDAKEYVTEKTSSVFGRKEVEPEAKEYEGRKPAAPAGGESH